MHNDSPRTRGTRPYRSRDRRAASRALSPKALPILTPIEPANSQSSHGARPKTASHHSSYRSSALRDLIARRFIRSRCLSSWRSSLRSRRWVRASSPVPAHDGINTGTEVAISTVRRSRERIIQTPPGKRRGIHIAARLLVQGRKLSRRHPPDTPSRIFRRGDFRATLRS
jgi:hypothetical protein